MKYIFLFSLLTAFAAQAQNFSPNAGAGVPSSTAPQGAGTILDGTSPSTSGQGDFTSPNAALNTFPANTATPTTTSPANTNTTLGDGTQSTLTPTPGTAPANTTLLNTPSNNPLPQAQQAPIEFSPLPDTTAPSTGTGSSLGTDSTGTGTNSTVPFDTFPGATPSN